LGELAVPNATMSEQKEILAQRARFCPGGQRRRDVKLQPLIPIVTSLVLKMGIELEGVEPARRVKETLFLSVSSSNRFVLKGKEKKKKKESLSAVTLLTGTD